MHDFHATKHYSKGSFLLKDAALFSQGFYSICSVYSCFWQESISCVRKCGTLLFLYIFCYKCIICCYILGWGNEIRPKNWSSSQRKGGWGKNCAKFQGGKMKIKVLQNSNWKKKKGKVRLVNKVNSRHLNKLWIKYILWGTLFTYKCSRFLSGKEKKPHPNSSPPREQLAHINISMIS